MRSSVLLIITLSLFACTNSRKGELPVILQAKEIHRSGSYFNLDEFQIYADEYSRTSAERLALELNKLDYNADRIISFDDPMEDHSINLLIDTSLSSTSGYYELTIKKDFVLIKGAGKEGLIHGVYTLIQLIPRSSGIDDSKIACVFIKDH